MVLVLESQKFRRHNSQLNFENFENWLYEFFKAGNEASETLLKLINDDRRIHLVPAKVHDIYFLRLAICSTKTTSADLQFAWKVILEQMQHLDAQI